LSFRDGFTGCGFIIDQREEAKMSLSEETTVLSSWKDIARYMGKGVRTVQRWEHHLGLPVRRPNGASHKSAVLLDRNDLETWLATRFSARESIKDLAFESSVTTTTARASLRESIRTARELRDTNLALTLQITESIRLLAQRCDLLSNHTRNTSLPLKGSRTPELPENSLAMETERIV
jgi:hypothetical protein